jgi:5-methylcytosine-specific restriction enzyme subunit McrC
MAIPTGVDAQPARRGPRVVTCQSHGPVEIPLEEVLEPSGHLRLNPDIENGDYFAVSLRAGALTLRARGFVGYIPLTEDIVVHVKPRVAVGNLSRIINLAGEPPTVLTSLRGYATTDEWSDSLLDIYADTLIGHVETIATSGLMRDYARREEVSSYPRGRVLLHPTIQRLYPRGIHHAVHDTRFERTVDGPANRCLKYACWALARRYMKLASKNGMQRQVHRKLNAVFALFDGVQLDHQLRFMDDPVVQGSRPLPTLRSYYRDALNVARAIIQQRAILIDSPGGLLRMPSIVMNMDYIFEGYVRNVLRTHAEASGWPVEVQNGNDEGKKDLFNEKPSQAATPDIVVAAPNGTFPLVLEVKNVPIKDLFSEREHIAQVITYALSYRAKRVVLVHPRRSASQPGGMRLLGVVDDVEVHQYRFDLGAQALKDEEVNFGEAVAALLPPARRDRSPGSPG